MKDLTREQINKSSINLKRFLMKAAKLAEPEVSVEDFLIDFDEIRTLALNFIPKAFDPESPPNKGWYFARQKKFYSWLQDGTHKTSEKITWRISYFEKGRWLHKKGGIYTYEEITSFMPIPEVGESK